MSNVQRACYIVGSSAQCHMSSVLLQSDNSN